MLPQGTFYSERSTIIASHVNQSSPEFSACRQGCVGNEFCSSPSLPCEVGWASLWTNGTGRTEGSIN